MKFRGIFAILAAALLVAVTAANANAAKLGYTQALTNGPLDATHNPNVPVGAVLYTIGVQLDAADGVGALGISLTFNGGVGSPIQTNTGGAGNNRIDNLQTLQNNIDGGLINATGITTGTFADSWFYSAGGGQLTTTDGDVNPPHPATANPQLLYPGLSANPQALAWNTSNSPNGILNTTGSAMSISGLWGNPTSADPVILAASQLGPGIYPVAQILVSVNGSVPIASGASLGIAVPNGKFYNVLGTIGGAGGEGAFISGNPLAYLQNPLALPLLTVPEPSTIALAGLGLVGVLFARRRRK